MSLRVFPRPPFGVPDPATQLLTQFGTERQTGVIGTTITLELPPIPATLALFKNGALLDPEDAAVYALADRTITLGVASIAGDIWVATYYFRSTRTG